jgi:diacylglycerol kinase family enzyme
VVPTGQTNHFARCLSIPKPSEALRAWQRFLDRGDNVRTVDLGTVRPMAKPAPDEAGAPGSRGFPDASGQSARPASATGPALMRETLYDAEEERMIYFSGVASLGLDAETYRRVRHMPGWSRGRLGMMLAALRVLASYNLPKVRLFSFDANGQETVLDGRALFVSVGNTPECEGGIRMLPQAVLDDGQLDLCFVPAMSKSLALFYFHRIYSGNHLTMARVRYLRTCQVFLESDRPVALYADGEYLCHTPAEISASPRALRVIVP